MTTQQKTSVTVAKSDPGKDDKQPAGRKIVTTGRTISIITTGDRFALCQTSLAQRGKHLCPGGPTSQCFICDAGHFAPH